MKGLWRYIDEKDWKSMSKYKIAYLILAIISSILGFALWSVLRIWILSSRQWMICFIGYPILFSLFLVFFYGCKHEFHNGKISS